jgi:hypothetical protein
MRELIALKAFGLDPVKAVRYYLALQMAERGLLSAPNAACGMPFNMGGSTITPLNPAAAGVHHDAPPHNVSEL